MSIKITDLMEHAENELLEEIEEIDIDRACIERIKTRTMEKIKEESGSKSVSKRNRRGNFRLRNMKRVLIIAVVLGALVGIAVGAISISPTLQAFFSNQLDLVLPHAQEVKESVSHNGVTMTVDTAIAGNSGGMIILSVTKDDGTTFEEESEFKNLNVNIEATGSFSHGYGWQLSEDGKTLTYVINLKALGQIVDTPIEVVGKDIVRVTQHEEVLPIELDKVKPARDRELYTNGEVDVNGAVELKSPENGEVKGIRLEHPYSDAVLGSVGFEGGEFYLYMEYTEVEGSLWQLYKLVDIRSGQTLYSDHSEGRSGSSSQITSKKVFYKGVTPEDLPYIKLVKLYNTYEVFNKGEWKLSFTLAPNKQIKTFRGKKTIEIEEERYEVEYIEISAVGGSIQGNKFTNHPESSIKDHKDYRMKLHLKDGSTMDMVEIMTSSGGNEGYYNLYTEIGKPWSLMTEKEKEEERRVGRENMYKRKTGYESLLELPFIDIEQVESIEIEGVIFPLK